MLHSLIVWVSGGDHTIGLICLVLAPLAVADLAFGVSVALGGSKQTCLVWGGAHVILGLAVPFVLWLGWAPTAARILLVLFAPAGLMLVGGFLLKHD
jgi:hypothetical protein